MNLRQKTSEAAYSGRGRNNSAAAVFSGANGNRHEVIEHISYEWDAALARSDVKGLLALYASDAVLESPLVLYLLGKEIGICTGHDELRPFFELLREHKPPIRQHYRTGYFSDGKKVMWEYPRGTPNGEQMDFVEVMEINNEGLIQQHNVYWGWFGVRVLQRDEYQKRKAA
jgi:hypothetical protein